MGTWEVEASTESGFPRGTDTSSGAIHATMVPDSKKVDMPYVERFCLRGDKEGVLQLRLDRGGKRMSSRWTRLADCATCVTDTEPSEQWSSGESRLHS